MTAATITARVYDEVNAEWKLGLALE